MTITKYFKLDVDDTIRIAIVTATDEDAMSETPEADVAMGAEEIAAEDLPANFAKWQEYTAHADFDAVVRVMSEDGQ